MLLFGLFLTDKKKIDLEIYDDKIVISKTNQRFREFVNKFGKFFLKLYLKKLETISQNEFHKFIFNYISMSGIHKENFEQEFMKEFETYKKNKVEMMLKFNT